MARLMILLVSLCALLSAWQGKATETAVDQAATSERFQGTLADGAIWRAAIPADWNGTLLLYSRGYSSTLKIPQLAPTGSEQSLLDAGYALAASQYPQAGWSVEQAIPSQVLVLDAFSAVYRKPQRVIAWGSSMGGLVTAALVENHSERLDGAITLCASAFGAVPMMNMALDGAMAVSQLIAPEENFLPVGRGDNFAQVKALMSKVQSARNTAIGRARVALAGVLGGVPSWTQPEAANPTASDITGQEAQIANAMGMALFLPRGDQERRARGIASGNVDVDYRALLNTSGRKAFVEAMYELADASLDEDLARLNAAQRISADPAAVDYMQRNFTPSGKVGVPVLNAHTIGDGMTSPALQAGYTQLVARKSGEDMVASVWIERAGHCTETPAERLALLTTLETRLESGQWPPLPDTLVTLSAQSADIAFTRYEPYPVPRACDRDNLCAAETR